MNMPSSTSSPNGQSAHEPEASHPAELREPVFWRVEGSLLNLTAVRPVGFFTWNAQSFLGRWARRGAMGALAIARPFLYATNRVFATRLLHSVLRGVSRDRLDLLGDEFFEYFLKPRLKKKGLEALKKALADGNRIVLVSQGLDHVMRPLANYLGVERILSNRLDFRDGIATGRLLDPVIRPRGPFAKFNGRHPDGRIPRERLLSDLGLTKETAALDSAIQHASREIASVHPPIVHFDSRRFDSGDFDSDACDSHNNGTRFSVAESLRGRHVLLIGATGFIGKVWLANLLSDLPGIGRISVLIRSNRSTTALQRFQRMVEESPVFEPLAARHADKFADFLRAHVEVFSGDVGKPDLGLAAEACEKLSRSVDVIVNSSGLTDFNPDLRDGLASNVRATKYLLDFLKGCHHAALLHLSTCYVVGKRDGRVEEDLPKNYTPAGAANFDAEEEWQSLEALIRETEARAESPSVTEELAPRGVRKGARGQKPAGPRAR